MKKSEKKKIQKLWEEESEPYLGVVLTGSALFAILQHILEISNELVKVQCKIVADDSLKNSFYFISKRK